MMNVKHILVVRSVDCDPPCATIVAASIPFASTNDKKQKNGKTLKLFYPICKYLIAIH